MRRLLATVIGAATILALASPGIAQPAAAAVPGVQQEKPAEPDNQPQRVTGKVVDRDGKAVDRVQVAFAGPKKETVWTDARGAFAFTGPPGDYVVTVKAGDTNHEFRVKIADHHLTPSTLVIDPAPDPHALM
jgi:hypothetical protein